MYQTTRFSIAEFGFLPSTAINTGPRNLLSWTLGLLLLLLWMASGLDLKIAGLMATVHGFLLRSSSVLGGLHELIRATSWAIFLAWNLWAWRRSNRMQGEAKTAHQKLWGNVAAAVLIILAAVLFMKRTSPSFCPWDLSPFGGTFNPQEPWQMGAANFGHCFPSAHAAGVFALLPIALYLERYFPNYIKNGFLAGVLGLGIASGTVQMLRGAHFFSHVWASAWIALGVYWLAQHRFSCRKTYVD
jgi:membrane-associated PAP2 superfamily phosphatase